MRVRCSSWAAVGSPGGWRARTSHCGRGCNGCSSGGVDTKPPLRLARTLADEGLPAEAASELEAATREACIVCCATTSTEPLVLGAWLAPGTHLDLVGGFTPHMREVDDAAVASARIVVDTYAGALAEAGDLVQPLARGAIGRERIVAELAELLRGQREGRTHAERDHALQVGGYGDRGSGGGASGDRSRRRVRLAIACPGQVA